ncbi:MAG TPA: type II toxin-antitoxin system PemK/MazF family toxin [Methyloceanibacter sp.]
MLWIDFGHPVGREQGGRRPALVLTSREYNLASSVLIVCPITRTRRNWPFAVALPPLGRLTGFVLVDQIKVIDPIRAFKREGTVPAEIMLEVRARLASLLGIPVSS